MGIFSDTAPKYWAVGLPAMPLQPAEKKPVVMGWQRFCDTMPDNILREEWLKDYSDGNIGLPMGPSAGLVGIDIDTDDEKIITIIDSVIPKSPWVRVGKKGQMRVYRFNDERSGYIRDAEGHSIFEIKSKGSQIALAPSIHPDTQKPYVENVPLYEICKVVPTLPNDVKKRIVAAFKANGIEVSEGGNNQIVSFIASGARDNTMVYHAGLLSRAVVRGERTLIQALGEMEVWVKNFVEQVVGDPLTVEKAKGKLIEFLIRDVTGSRRQGLPTGWDEGLSDDDKKALGLEFTEDDEKWGYKRILDYIKEQFERTPDDKRSDIRMSAINIALDRIVKAGATISALEESLILRYIATQSAGTILQSDLKRQLNSVRKGDINGENHKELAESTLEYLNQYGEMRFDAGSFWQWKGASWEIKDESEILKVIAEEFGDYPAARRQSDHMGILRVMRSIAAEPLQQSGRGLNFANGFLNDKLELVGHDPNQGMTYILPYRYLPEKAGHMEMFNQYLHDSWGDDPDYKDKIMALQEAMGATLFSHATSFQRAFCLFGQAGSGKSRLSQIMRGMLPDNSMSAIPPHDWRDRFIPANMFGKVLNFAGELSENKNIPGDIFKQIIEGETITAQHKNQAPFQFRPMCAHWFNSNHLPRTKDYTDGFNRRWLFLEWNKRVEEHKKIPDLDKIILEVEREAIVAWAVLGYERLIKNGGFTLPTSHLALVDQMAVDNNSVRFFLQACPRIVIGQNKVPDSTISATELHTEYWQFCLTTSTAQRVSLQAFVKMMKELQPVFGFRERVVKTNSGHPEVVFDWIDIADNVKVGKIK